MVFLFGTFKGKIIDVTIFKVVAQMKGRKKSKNISKPDEQWNKNTWLSMEFPGSLNRW